MLDVLKLQHNMSEALKLADSTHDAIALSTEEDGLHQLDFQELVGILDDLGFTIGETQREIRRRMREHGYGGD